MPQVFQHTLSFSGDPFEVFDTFKDQPHLFFLDSSLKRGQDQFSYIGFAPFATVDGGDLSGLRKRFDKYRFVHKGLAFPAGAVGYLGYDGSLFFGFYDTVLAIDHQKKKLVISSLSQNRIKDVLVLIRKNISLSHPHRSSALKGEGLRKRPLDFQSNFTKAAYMKAVRQALEHIRRGDIYQINLSHQIKVPLPRWRDQASSAVIYKNLRQCFPSEFGAYFDDGRQVIVSASPERFVRLQKGVAQVKPMKGTRPRGNTKAQDKELKDRLLKSPKEIAELLMVTDLERNDLGRVCDYSTVKVKVMRAIETYASVFQATSTVEGRLRRDCDSFDLLQAAFPSGSVTGCPKIEAMKIIKRLERGPRGLYTGALGYMSFSGDMDFNVLIRSMFLRDNQITFHIGGGIVADSIPLDEWQETLIKAQPMIETLRKTFL